MAEQIKAGDFVYPTDISAFLNLNPFFDYLQEMGILKPLTLADPKEDKLKPIKVIGVHNYERSLPGQSQILLISELDKKAGTLAILDGNKVELVHRPLYNEDGAIQLTVHPDINIKNHPGWSEYRMLFYKGAKGKISEVSANPEAVWYLIEFDELSGAFFSVEETWIEPVGKDEEITDT